MKRLFLFAGYDKDAIIDDSLLYYLNHLSGLGDVVFVMDSDASDTELAKVKQIPNVLYAAAQRHGEYDFGSYKRAYIWARDNKLLEKYDWVYLVNDSVLGPLFDLNPIVEDLESRGVDLTGMISNEDEFIPWHIQSWFVGLSQQVATADFFDEFMCGVKRQDCKDNIVLKYEIRLSRVIVQRGYTAYAYSESKCKEAGFLVYANPLTTLKSGIPCVKKAALKNIKGVKYMNPYLHNETVLDFIFNYAKRNGIELDNAPRRFGYCKNFRLTFLSIPLCTVHHQNFRTVHNYKVCIFDKIPVLKISLRKK